MSKPTAITPDLQTIVWDLDGTLLDSFGIYRDCLNEVLQKLGRPHIHEQIFRNNHGFIEDSIANVLHEAGQTTTKAEMAQIIREFYVLDNAYIADVDHHLFEDAVDFATRAHNAGKQPSSWVVDYNYGLCAVPQSGCYQRLLVGTLSSLLVGPIEPPLAQTQKDWQCRNCHC